MRLVDLVKNFARPFAAPALVRRSPKAPPAAKTSAAGPMIAWSGVGQPRWTPRRYENLAEEGFRKNVIAYRCVMQIAAASSAIPWLLYDDQGEEIDRHPLLDLLCHPNPLQDGVTFLESVYAYLEIAGNAYIEAVQPEGSKQPVELYVLRPDRMKVIPGPAGLPQGYQYNVNGQVTSWPADPITGASSILHLKRFHPLDDWYGMAPMEAAQISIDQHNAAGAWNKSLLDQGARPSGALVYAPKDGPSALSDEQMQRLREEVGQLYSGSRNAGRPLILEGGLDWREMSLSPKDMDWLAGRNTAARDIALAFGMPAQMVGIPDSQTYANMAEARMAFYEETVLPLVTRVIAGFDHWLTPMYGDDLQLDFDPDSISALTPRRDQQWSKLQNAAFLTRNEKREAAGYGPVPGGDAEDDSDDDEPGAVDALPKLYGWNPYAWQPGKFNPNHDPSNGQFTFGSGGDDDDYDEDDNNDQNQGTISDQIGRLLQSLLGIGTAHAEDYNNDDKLLSQPPSGQDPGSTQATLNNGKPVTYEGEPFIGVDGNLVSAGTILNMPNGVSLSNNAALGEKLSLLPSMFTPGITVPTPLLSGINSVPAREAAMTALFAPDQSMDYQRIYSDNDSINHAYINFGNYNYGVVAAASGYDLNQALFASGLANLWGGGDKSGSMFNNPGSLPWIKQGFSDYNKGLISGK